MTVSAATDWTTTPPANDNYQFTDFTVNASTTLNVLPGTTIRCTGTFTNNGTIVVAQAASPGNACTVSGVGLSLVIDPGADAWGNVAGLGENTPTTTYAYGGAGYGPNATFAEILLNVGVLGGGGGAGNGGSGGGTLTVLAETAAINASGATISAQGQTTDGTMGCAQGGGGGGGGGIVILASMTQVTQAGTIDVRGGGGGPSSTYFAPGGGGAGGMVHILAPTITHTGTENLSAGAQGSGTGSITANPRTAGSSGGASGGGYGGSGASIDASNNIVAGTAGKSGLLFQSNVDPTALFW